MEQPIGRLLVVDHVRAYDGRPEGMVFVFDGGVLREASFVFGDGEVVSAGFYPLEEVRARVKPMLANRIAAALDAVHDGATALCEQGIRVR